MENCDNEKYLTAKELQYELWKLGLPSSRSYIDKLKIRGAPFVGKRARLSEIIDWEKKQTKANASKRKQMKAIESKI